MKLSRINFKKVQIGTFGGPLVRSERVGGQSMTRPERALSPRISREIKNRAKLKVSDEFQVLEAFEVHS